MQRAAIGQLLKPGKASHGYWTVNLNRKNHIVGILVLRAFVGPCPPGMESCHNDGVKCNNVLTNLRWDTRRGNAKDRRSHGTHLFGERSIGAVLTEENVREIRRAKGTISQFKLSIMFGVSPSNIQAIHDGRSWRHVV
jgi:hypothetical protein